MKKTLTKLIFMGLLSMFFKSNAQELSSIYDLTYTSITGKKVSLETYKGKYILFVNVASECGFTSQYEDLQALYEKNKDKLEIIAVPCNDYGSQESGSNSEIKNFCETRYGVSFTMGSKQKIKSSPISDLYQWLSDPKQNGWNSSLPSWNFCKYVINEDGQLTHFLRSGVNPTGKEMLKIIDG